MFDLFETTDLPELNLRSTPALIYYPKSLAKKSVFKTIFPQDRSYERIMI